jgi:hypothetical protein
MLERIAAAVFALVGCGVPLSGAAGQSAPPSGGEAVVTSVVEPDFRFATWEGTRRAPV